MAVITSGHDVADARLHREVAAMQRRGLTVEILGLGDPSDAPAGANVRTWRRKGQARRAVHAVTLPLRIRSSVAITFDPDVALTSLVWRRSGLRRWALVSDVHEDYEALLLDRVWAQSWRLPAARAAARAGAFAASHADLTVVADDHLLRSAPRRLVLRNHPDLSLLPSPSDPDPEPRALYIGDIRRSRGLPFMLDALREAPAWTLDLVGPVADAGDRALLEQVHRDPRLRGRVRVHPQMPPRAAWALAQGAWIGMLLLHDTPAFRAAMPSKLYEYTASGLAVLATPLPRVSAFLDETRNGALTNSPGAAAELLNRWATEPARLAELRSAARAWSERQPLEPVDLATYADRVATLVTRERG